MINLLVGAAIGLVTFILVLGVGNIVTNEFGDAVGGDTNTTIQNLKAYLGTGNGSIGGWTGAVIALIIGVAFIGAIMQLSGKNQ